MSNTITNYIKNGLTQITRDADAKPFPADKKELFSDVFLAIPRRAWGEVIHLNKDHTSNTLPSISKVYRVFLTIVLVVTCVISIPMTLVGLVIASKSDSRKDVFAAIAQRSINSDGKNQNKIENKATKIEDNSKIESKEGQELKNNEIETTNINKTPPDEKTVIKVDLKNETINKKKLNTIEENIINNSSNIVKEKEKTSYENLLDEIEEWTKKIKKEKELQLKNNEKIKKNQIKTISKKNEISGQLSIPIKDLDTNYQINWVDYENAINKAKKELETSYLRTTNLERELYKLEIKRDRYKDGMEINDLLTDSENQLIDNFNAATIKAIGGIESFIKLKENILIAPNNWNGHFDADLKNKIRDINQPIILGQIEDSSYFLVFTYALLIEENKRIIHHEVLIRGKNLWLKSPISNSQLTWGSNDGIRDSSPEEAYMINRFKSLINHKPVGRLKDLDRPFEEAGVDTNTIKDSFLKGEELNKFLDIQTFFYEEECKKSPKTDLLLIKPQDEDNLKEIYHKYFPKN